MEYLLGSITNYKRRFAVLEREGDQERRSYIPLADLSSIYDRDPGVLDVSCPLFLASSYLHSLLPSLLAYMAACWPCIISCLLACLLACFYVSPTLPYPAAVYEVILQFYCTLASSRSSPP